MSCYCSRLIARLVARNNRREQNADRVRPPAVPFSPCTFSLFFATSPESIVGCLRRYLQTLLKYMRDMLCPVAAIAAATRLQQHSSKACPRSHAATKTHRDLANAPTL